MAKPKFRITNRHTYNKALINSGSMTFWLDDEAIHAWYESAMPASRGRPQHYSDLAITTVLVIDSTGLKLFGEGEWEVKKHGKERRRTWRKLHLAVDANTHKIICADLSLNNVTDSEALRGLFRQTHRKIRSAAVDGAYGTRLCHDELRRKKIRALIPPERAQATALRSMQTGTVPLRINV